MSTYQIIVTFAFEHEFTEEQIDNGDEIPHAQIAKQVRQMLKDKDYSVEEHEM